ncbi:hypothetical protein MMC26_006907 [Xylographa opegraphella]|nr:hypothetical protein [Xylographa opegraphella]
MSRYYTYVPHPRPKSPEPKKASYYYNYHPPHAGRLTDAYPPCFYTYGPVAHVHTPNVPKEYIPVVYVTSLSQLILTHTPKAAPVCYTSYPQYYCVEAAPAPKPAAPKPPTPKPPTPKPPTPKPPTPKPDKHVYWYGSSRQEVDVQNHAIHKAHAKPTQMVPYEPSAEEQFWVRELDGSWTLRTAKDVGDNCQPGYWQEGESGYPLFIRTA